jgi:hypothetical protein
MDVIIQLVIENHYADAVIETRETVTTPSYPHGRDDFDWWQEYIWPLTGTGRSGDAVYEVGIVDSSDPKLIGKTHVFA